MRHYRRGSGDCCCCCCFDASIFHFTISDFSLLFSFRSYFAGIFMCTYSYMGFGHSPTHRFSSFVDLTTFNISGGVRGAFDDYGEEESTSTLPLFFFPFFLSFVERVCVLALCLGVIGIDTQKHGVQRVEDFCSCLLYTSPSPRD